MKTLIFCIALLASSIAHAVGGQEGSGGDTCENRFLEVRNDLKTWIADGGSRGLKLSTTPESYDSAMTAQIATALVSCTDAVIKVGTAEKTCKNFSDNDSAHILCNTKRFLDTNESDQYVLVHHEYAGLAQIEVSRGQESSYEISNQISGFLEDRVVKKLSIKPVARVEDPFDPASCQGTAMSSIEAMEWIAQQSTATHLPWLFRYTLHRFDLASRTRRCLEKTGECTSWYDTPPQEDQGSWGLLLKTIKGQPTLLVERNDNLPGVERCAFTAECGVVDGQPHACGALAKRRLSSEILSPSGKSRWACSVAGTPISYQVTLRRDCARVTGSESRAENGIRTETEYAQAFRYL